MIWAEVGTVLLDSVDGDSQPMDNILLVKSYDIFYTPNPDLKLSILLLVQKNLSMMLPFNHIIFSLWTKK